MTRIVRTPIRAPFHTPIHAAGLFSSLLYVCLHLLVSSTGQLPVSNFLVILFTLFISSILLVRYSLRHNKPPSLQAIIGWAVIFRLIGIFSVPIFEDDFYRYLWDGFQFAQTGSPYGLAPSAFFGDDSIAEQIQVLLDGINHPDIPTIYGPVFQYSFLLGYALFPADVFGLQLIYVVADVCLILILSRMSNRSFLILYAWCPLVIKEIAFTAHPDVLGVVLLMGSLYCLHRNRQRTAVILIAFSVCAKVFAILLVPFILMRCKSITWLYFPTIVCLLYAPFVWNSGADLAGLLAFTQNWQFNSSLYVVMNNWITPDLSKAVCLAIFGGFYFTYGYHFFRNKQLLIPRGDWIFGMFFLVAPVVNAWYLIWLLAFATIFPSRWAWVASASILLSYITGYTVDDANLALYQQPIWARIVEYGVILCALTIDWYYHQQTRNINHRPSYYQTDVPSKHIQSCVD